MNTIVGFSSLFLAAATFGSFGLWIRLLDRELSIYQQIVLRNIFAFAIVLAIVLVTKKLRHIKWKEANKWQLLSYVFLVPVAVILYNISILNTKIAITTFSYFIGSILVGWVVGTFFYHEKLSIERWLSLILVIVGLSLFAYPFSSGSMNVGFLLGIGSGIIDGVANAFRKELSGKIDKMVLVLLSAIGGIIVSGYIIVYAKESLLFFSSLSQVSWVIGALFGFILIAVNYLLLLGFQNFDLSLGSVILSLELFFAVVFGLVFFKEYPTSFELAGGVIILLANIVPNTNIISRVMQRNTLLRT